MELPRQRARYEIVLQGAVQGVGFRPFAARLARDLGLAGSVCNAGAGVRIVLEGERGALERALAALRAPLPGGARIEQVSLLAALPRGERGFRIAASACEEAAPRMRIPPDLRTCATCLDELFDPANRRYRYPFTHCAACGPRASVLRGLPFDRARTSLASFPLCAACVREYEDPDDRRYHAETLSCPACGPRLAASATRNGAPCDPVEAAAAQILAGGIVALKGYGGFHLACDARSRAAVARLREHKRRPSKPFALLLPDLLAARALADLRPDDETLLAGPAAAIVIASRRASRFQSLGLARELAPHTDDLGLLLPCAPLHWLLLFAPGAHPRRSAARFPALVLTSANRSGEPTLHENAAARALLGGLADLVVEHDRQVARPSDDPVFRSAPGGPIPLRLARGTSPRALPLPAALRDAPPLLALGGDLKCAPALVAGGEILLAEHVGDLGSVEAADALEARVAELCRIAGVRPEAVAFDAHPDSQAAALAQRSGLRPIPVQHHHAHALACLVEHGEAGPALALALDGAGFGSDGHIWGGELLHVDAACCQRLAHLEHVPLPGGDAAAREPWRMAAAWLAIAFPEGAPRLAWHARRDPARLRAVEALVRHGATPLTSSCGRLFDAVASLLDAGDEASHEGEVAIALECLAARGRPGALAEPLAAAGGAGRCAPSAAPLVRAIVLARAAGAPREDLALAFHQGLAALLAAAAVRAAARTGARRVALTGGCFQNRLLLEAACARLADLGLAPLVHRHVPPSDGGLAVGQAAAAAARLLRA